MITFEINLPPEDGGGGGAAARVRQAGTFVRHSQKAIARMREDHPEAEFWVVTANHGAANLFNVTDGVGEMLFVPAPFDANAWKYIGVGMTVVIRFRNVSRQNPYIAGVGRTHTAFTVRGIRLILGRWQQSWVYPSLSGEMLSLIISCWPWRPFYFVGLDGSTGDHSPGPRSTSLYYTGGNSRPGVAGFVVFPYYADGHAVLVFAGLIKGAADEEKSRLRVVALIPRFEPEVAVKLWETVLPEEYSSMLMGGGGGIIFHLPSVERIVLTGAATPGRDRVIVLRDQSGEVLSNQQFPGLDFSQASVSGKNIVIGWWESGGLLRGFRSNGSGYSAAWTLDPKTLLPFGASSVAAPQGASRGHEGRWPVIEGVGVERLVEGLLLLAVAGRKRMGVGVFQNGKPELNAWNVPGASSGYAWTLMRENLVGDNGSVRVAGLTIRAVNSSTGKVLGTLTFTRTADPIYDQDSIDAVSAAVVEPSAPAGRFGTGSFEDYIFLAVSYDGFAAHLSGSYGGGINYTGPIPEIGETPDFTYYLPGVLSPDGIQPFALPDYKFFPRGAAMFLFPLIGEKNPDEWNAQDFGGLCPDSEGFIYYCLGVPETVVVGAPDSFVYEYLSQTYGFTGVDGDIPSTTLHFSAKQWGAVEHDTAMLLGRAQVTAGGVLAGRVQVDVTIRRPRATSLERPIPGLNWWTAVRAEGHDRILVVRDLPRSDETTAASIYAEIRVASTLAVVAGGEKLNLHPDLDETFEATVEPEEEGGEPTTETRLRWQRATNPVVKGGSVGANPWLMVQIEFKDLKAEYLETAGAAPYVYVMKTRAWWCNGLNGFPQVHRWIIRRETAEDSAVGVAEFPDRASELTILQDAAVWVDTTFLIEDGESLGGPGGGPGNRIRIQQIQEEFPDGFPSEGDTPAF